MSHVPPSALHRALTREAVVSANRPARAVYRGSQKFGHKGLLSPASRSIAPFPLRRHPPPHLPTIVFRSPRISPPQPTKEPLTDMARLLAAYCSLLSQRAVWTGRHLRPCLFQQAGTLCCGETVSCSMSPLGRAISSTCAATTRAASHAKAALSADPKMIGQRPKEPQDCSLSARLPGATERVWWRKEREMEQLIYEINTFLNAANMINSISRT